ncbi:MAG TPA: lysylphosphatidylglycerol synthase transmembrane domain-containing protein [Acidobacteriaceae bacterium]
MKSTRTRIMAVIILLAVVALVWFGRHRIHFDWHAFGQQLRMADWRRIAFGLGCIYAGYLVRSVRWAWLLRHKTRFSPLSLLGTQVMGFTAVALIGRMADPVRPYLVAKKTSLPLSSQFAVYVVERLFDAGSMALITCSVILLAPSGALPHPEIVRKAGVWGLALTLAGSLFLVAVRWWGNAVAAFFGRALSLVSKRLGEAVKDKIQSFHSGLDTMRSFSDFGITAALSLGMWLMIAVAYLETMRAFVASPELAGMTLAKAVLLMVVSGGASVIQLPVIGWFTQIGLVAGAITKFFGAAPEAATGCAAALLLVTFLGIVPIGLIWSRFEHISLTRVTEESEHAGEELAHSGGASTLEA